MRNKIIVIGVLLVVAAAVFGGIYHYKYDTVENHYETGGNVIFTQNGVSFQKYWNEDFGLSFAYRISPNGYTLVETDPKTISSTQDIEKFLTLYNTAEYNDFKKSTTPREAPRNISIRVFKNPNNLSVQEWLNLNAAQVNYNSSGIRPQEASFGGVSGLRFMADGLYPTDTVVLTNNYKMYVFSGQFDSQEDSIRTDFLSLLQSLILF